MFHFYFDEVKYEPPIQNSFWLGGIGVKDTESRMIEGAVNEVALRTFGHTLLTKECEFHGKELSHGKGAFKGVALDDRLKVIKDLLQIIASEEIVRFYVQVIPENIGWTSKKPDEIAFMYLIEKINAFLVEKSALGMLFGDYDEPSIGGTVVSLSSYRRNGTSWSRGTNIENLLDTVHFAKSHHSRFIQLADVYLYFQQFFSYIKLGNWRDSVNLAIKDSGMLRVTFNKVWPQEKVWYR